MDNRRCMFFVILFMNFNWSLSESLITLSTEKTSFTFYEIRKFITFLNDARNNVVPKAADMNFVQWDEILANKAEKDVASCHSQLSANKIVYRGNHSDLEYVIEAWRNEFITYNIPDNRCVERNLCDVYQKIIQAEVKTIGCGINKCWNDNEYLILCYIDRVLSNTTKPYIIGKPCSVCKTHLCAQNLCGLIAIVEIAVYNKRMICGSCLE
ncbi:GLIPR1-like protein 1 [Centruroides vittatus]|uniref:GLIPR1-like protein 1 n=1 Tax=Centruroides vittatus TaxID=120091 RepID=UPI0035102012